MSKRNILGTESVATAASNGGLVVPEAKPAVSTASVKVQSPITMQALQARIAELEAEKAKTKLGRGIFCRITDGSVSATTGKATSKGAICVYGLQRMPITLYPQQWERLRSVLNGEIAVKQVKGNDTEFTFADFIKAGIDAGLCSMERDSTPQ